MITVVLPVYNGGALLRVCIESLARQDSAPGSFDVVVLDNCSTDGALDALRVLPERIPRRVIRSERLLPIEQNWARIKELSDVRQFVTTIGHDDTFDPGFIRIMSCALREEPDVRLLFAHFRLIDQAGTTIRPCYPMAPWESAGQFLAGRFARIRDSFGTGYVMRFDEYRAVGGIPGYAKLIFADDALWVGLAQRSRIRILEEECFSYRLHPSSTSRSTDSGVVLGAFSSYVDFLEGQLRVDHDIRRAMTSYGAGYAQALATRWIAGEVHRANVANEVARADIVEGWRDVHRRFLSLIDKPELYRAESGRLALSLRVNRSAILRRCYAVSRATAQVARRARHAVGAG